MADDVPMVPPSTEGHRFLRVMLTFVLTIGLIQVVTAFFDGLGTGAGVVLWRTVGPAGLLVVPMLIFGPQPRLATKWAWFWVALAVPPLWLAFVLVEPVPLWVSEPISPARVRLPSLPAFLAALVIGPALAWVVPWYSSVY